MLKPIEDLEAYKSILAKTAKTTCPCLAIVGPTASGKTQLSQALAEHLDAEIISADSMQIYAGMDIGTAKIAPSERSVAYWGLDIVNPGQDYSCALFQAYGRAAILDIVQRGKQAIVCGGTGLYVRALLEEFDFPQGEQSNNPVRDAYTNRLAEIGEAALWEELYSQDPDSARLIHPHNTRRVIRAFELLAEGKSYAELNKGLKEYKPVVPNLSFALHVDPELLKTRIEKRIDLMFRQGLIDEVKALLEAGFYEGLCAKQAIGYKEVVWALEGQISMEEARERIIIASRQYAKRQRTWFKSQSQLIWLEASEYDEAKLLKEILHHLGQWHYQQEELRA